MAQALHQHPHDGDRIFGIYAHVEEELGARRGLRIGARQDRGIVTDRVLRASEHYPRETAFYRSLGVLRPAFGTSSQPGRRVRPWVRVNRISPLR